MTPPGQPQTAASAAKANVSIVGLDDRLGRAASVRRRAIGAQSLLHPWKAAAAL
jgi:hypothetical protein